MSATVADLTPLDQLDQLDYDISLASIVLGVARADWRRCPSAANALRLAEAQRDVDALLDERLAVHR